MSSDELWRVVDLFSGGGGMSYGFQAHPDFEVVAAADAQLGKPSSKRGSLGCNSTYEINVGVRPVDLDLGTVDPDDLVQVLGLNGPIDVLAACPPCTGFSRTNAKNHLVDDVRNSLVTRVALYARALQPRVIVMENARELLTGNFRHHFDVLAHDLESQGYEVHGATHVLNRFGLPQVRERALVVAVQRGHQLVTLDDLWSGFEVIPEAATVRRAIEHLPAISAGQTLESDPDHTAPRFRTAETLARIAAIPHDGGSWRDLLADRHLRKHLTPAMRELVKKKKLGSHPDVYGRARWDSAIATIKRECGHVGNGRYAHPEQDRLLSLREMAILNGFPSDYRFGGRSLANRYRHVGDAVPPLVSYQIAGLASWILSGVRPAMSEVVLPNSHLNASDIVDRNASRVAA